MKKKEIEVFSDTSDNSVVRLPGRNYLGSVMPGDSLFLMHGDAMDILEELKHNPGSYGYFKTYSIAKALESRLSHYIDVCSKNDIHLNFDLELSVLDYEEPL